MTEEAGGGPSGTGVRAPGWLRPVQLCLATAVRGPDGRVWPHPAAFVWRDAEDDQRRRREALEALLEPAACTTTDGAVLAVYRISTPGHSQTGLLADVKVDAYEAGRVKGHEHTRHHKEEALLAELDEVEALVGPVALAHHPHAELAERLQGLSREPPSASWSSADEALHELWVVEGGALETLGALVVELDPLYIVDGHHRIAAAARRAAARRREGLGPAEDGDPWGAFLAAVFPADHLAVRATHRIVDLDDDPEALFERLAGLGTFTPAASAEEARPRSRREFGVGTAGRWFRLGGLEPPPGAPDPYPDVQALDDLVLGPVLGISDPRSDPRIDFFPDLGDLGPVDERCRDGSAVAFLVQPLTVEEVFAVADAGAALPPKSTWFDPKPIKGAVLPAPRLPTRPGGA